MRPRLSLPLPHAAYIPPAFPPPQTCRRRQSTCHGSGRFPFLPGAASDNSHLFQYSKVWLKTFYSPYFRSDIH